MRIQYFVHFTGLGGFSRLQCESVYVRRCCHHCNCFPFPQCTDLQICEEPPEGTDMRATSEKPGLQRRVTCSGKIFLFKCKVYAQTSTSFTRIPSAETLSVYALPHTGSSHATWHAYFTGTSTSLSIPSISMSSSCKRKVSFHNHNTIMILTKLVSIQ